MEKGVGVVMPPCDLNPCDITCPSCPVMSHGFRSHGGITTPTSYANISGCPPLYSPFKRRSSSCQHRVEEGTGTKPWLHRRSQAEAEVTLEARGWRTAAEGEDKRRRSPGLEVSMPSPGGRRREAGAGAGAPPQKTLRSPGESIPPVFSAWLSPIVKELHRGYAGGGYWGCGPPRRKTARSPGGQEQPRQKTVKPGAQWAGGGGPRQKTPS